MADNIMTMPVGRLSLSRICYFCNLQDASGLVIPLGAIAEATLGHVRVLGLIARTKLLDEEAEAVGHLLRHKLSAPFDFLKDEFDWAWANTEAGQALPALAAKHNAALFFSPPKPGEIRKAVALMTGLAAADFAREELRRARDDEFVALLLDTWPKREAVIPNRDISELAA